MSITVTAVKARQNLGELLNLVSIKHEDVIIERAGKKIARLTSVEPETDTVQESAEATYATRNEKKKGKIDLSEFFGTWSEEEYREFNAAVECLGTIDPEMWE
jgi:prevent-host-death family protein